MNKKKIIYSLLKEIGQGNEPKHSDYEIDFDEFGEVVEMAMDSGILKGATVIRGGQGNKVLAVFLKGSTVTLKGLDFLEENSLLAKTYKGLKEIRDWFKP